LRIHEKTGLNDAIPTAEPTVFDVRFGPEKPDSMGEEWPNNIQLAGSGRVVVSADSVRFSDGRDASAQRHQTFLMSDIANVGYAENESGRIVAVRTRNDDREVLVWMASSAEAQSLLALLPRTTTHEFTARQQHHQRFQANLARLAPKARVTPAIIGINVAVFVLMVAAGANLVAGDARVALRFGSDYGPLTWGGQPWRLVTANFIHFGLIHIAFNMYALYNGGLWTERLYGSARFAMIYLLSGLSGSVVSGWWEPMRNSAGASGAVFGVYGALLVFFWRRADDIPRDLLKDVRSGAISLCVYSLAMGAVMPFVDNAAHVGGLLGGAAAGFFLVRPFEPGARGNPDPWRLVRVAAGVTAALALLAAPLLLHGVPDSGIR
jgi:rhomboid protease GluP